MHKSFASLLAFALLMPLALAKPLVLQGQVAGWPTGKTGTLQVHAGAGITYVPYGEKPLATSRIDGQGRFQLTLPENPLPDAPTDRTFLAGDPSACQLSQGKPMVLLPISLVVFNSKGQLADLVQMESSGKANQGFELVHVAASGRVVGTCQPGNLSLDLHFNPGWNILVSQKTSKGQTWTSAKPWPGAVRWLPRLKLQGVQ